MNCNKNCNEVTIRYMVCRRASLSVEFLISFLTQTSNTTSTKTPFVFFFFSEHSIRAPWCVIIDSMRFTRERGVIY